MLLTCTAVSRTAPTVRTVLSGLGTSALLLNISLLSSGPNSSLSCPTVKLHFEDLSTRTLCGRQPLQPRWWKTRFTTEGDGEAPLKFVKQIQRQATSFNHDVVVINHDDYNTVTCHCGASCSTSCGRLYITKPSCRLLAL